MKTKTQIKEYARCLAEKRYPIITPSLINEVYIPLQVACFIRNRIKHPKNECVNMDEDIQAMMVIIRDISLKDDIKKVLQLPHEYDDFDGNKIIVSLKMLDHNELNSEQRDTEIKEALYIFCHIEN